MLIRRSIIAWKAEEIGREDPEGCLNPVATALALGRHLSDDGMMIHLLTGIAVEAMIYSVFSELVGEWDRSQRVRLTALMDGETAELSLSATVAREADFIRSRLSRVLYSISGSELIGEGLIRISGVVIFPGETWIVLEHLGLGISFN